jgi:hypothetical protein
MRLSAICLAAVPAWAIFACGGPRSSAPVIMLSTTPDTVPTRYSEISPGAWLGGERWAVVAPPDEVAGIADLGSGRVVPLAGDDKKALRNPSTLFRSGDTLYVNDWGLRRTTLWSLGGRYVRAVPSADAARGALPEARDGAGRFYYEVAPRPGPDGSGNRDSSVVLRSGADPATLDTVARLAPLDITEVQSDAGRRFERRVFSGTDHWGVLPDGSLWVARVYDNRVDWRDPAGHWTKGEPLPDRVLEVTRYDRELFLRKFPPELRGTAEQFPFAAVKPPFEEGLTAPSGDVWLEKSRAPADSARRYHVVGRDGRLLREIHLPGSGRIVAVGQGDVLVAEPSQEGVRLLRFPVPTVPATP